MCPPHQNVAALRCTIPYEAGHTYTFARAIADAATMHEFRREAAVGRLDGAGYVPIAGGVD